MYTFERCDGYIVLSSSKNTLDHSEITVFIIDDEYGAAISITKDYGAHRLDFAGLKREMPAVSLSPSRDCLARAPWALLEVPEITTVYLGEFPKGNVEMFWVSKLLATFNAKSSSKNVFFLDHLEKRNIVNSSPITSARQLLKLGVSAKTIFSYSSGAHPDMLDQLEGLNISRSNWLHKSDLDADPVGQWNKVVRPLI